MFFKKKKITLLVVDDSWIDLSIIKSQIDKSPAFEALYAKDLADAKTILESKETIHAVLTDHRLSGDERGKHILQIAKDRIPRCPVFLVTATDLNNLSESIRDRMGLDLFTQVFEKPSDIDEWQIILKTISLAVESIPNE